MDGSLFCDVGSGIIVPGRIGLLSRKLTPTISLRDIAIAELKKKGVKIVPSTPELEYNSGCSTQVPTGRVIGVDRPVDLNIQWNGIKIYFEVMNAKSNS